MYAPFFGLKREPFSIAPDPRYLFMSERHREALAHLLYGVRAGGGFVLLTGEIGAGKTTVCRCFLEQIPKRCNVAYIFNPRLTVEELLRSICEEFHVPLPEPTGRGAPTVKDYLDPLNDYLLKTHAVGQNNVLIIDEAQALSAEVLEQLRLLTNLETPERKLLQVILIGQPELRDVLARPELEQLAQRVIARFHLGALSEQETAQYVSHRLEVAGLKRALPFSAEAIALVHRLARGVPRRINLLCDRAMLGAYAAGRPRIGRTLVRQAAAEVFDESMAAGAATVGGWPRGAVLAAGVLIGVALAGLAGWGLATRTAPGASLAGAASAPEPAASADAPELAASAAASPASAPVTGPLDAAPAAPAAASAPDGPTAAAAPVPAAAAITEEAAAWRLLAERWKLPADAIDDDVALCRVARQKGLACYRGRASVATLRKLDRPALLWLASGQADAAPRLALLEDFARGHARLRLGAVAQELPLAALQQRWRGEFATLWRPPPGWVAPQVEGRETPAAKWVAERLARVQRDVPALITAAEAAASDPLARDAAFEARVRAFQRSQGLSADGVLGPITLMQLNRAAGVDEPRLAHGDGG